MIDWNPYNIEEKLPDPFDGMSLDMLEEFGIDPNEETVRMDIPTYIDPSEYSERELWIVHLISWGRNNKKYEDRNGTPLWSTALRFQYPSGNYKCHIDSLIERGIIYRVEDHSNPKGRSGKCRTYDLMKDPERFKKVDMTDKPLKRNILKWRYGRDYDFAQTEEYWQLKETLERTELNFGRAMGWAREADVSNSKKKIYLSQLRRLKDEHRTVHLCRTNGRISHRFTNLKSEFRKLLTIDGENIKGWDKSQSQAEMAAEVIGEDKAPKFYQAVKEERAYEEFAKNLSPDDFTDTQLKRIFDGSTPEEFERDEGKVLCFATIYSDWTEFQYLKEKIKNFFPGLIENGGGRDFAIEMQKKEAKLALEVIRRCRDEGIPVLPFYDGFYTIEKRYEELEEICREVFDTNSFHCEGRSRKPEAIANDGREALKRRKSPSLHSSSSICYSIHPQDEDISQAITENTGQYAHPTTDPPDDLSLKQKIKFRLGGRIIKQHPIYMRTKKK